MVVPVEKNIELCKLLSNICNSNIYIYITSAEHVEVDFHLE